MKTIRIVIFLLAAAIVGVGALGFKHTETPKKPKKVIKKVTKKESDSDSEEDDKETASRNRKQNN